MNEFTFYGLDISEMPDGWRKAFGEEMCREIAEELDRSGLRDGYQILQIKEKFGALTWYDHGGNLQINAIKNKYRQRSIHTCIRCGVPATRVTTLWISPYCDACVPTWGGGNKSDTVSLEDYLEEAQGGGVAVTSWQI